MPEPVVIIGPASGPAGPIEESVGDAADTPAAGSGIEPEKRQGIASMLMRQLATIGAGLVGALVWLFRAVGTMVMGLFQRYPRHTLAAGASVLILGAIWYSEAGGRGPLGNQIGGKSSAAAPQDGNKSASTPTEGGTSSPAKVASKGSGDGGAVKPVGNAPAPAGPTAPDETPAPAPTVVVRDDPAPALPSLPSGSAGDLGATKSEPAPAPASTVDQSTPSLLAGGLPEPAPTTPPAGADEVKVKADAVKPAPPMEAPALIGALAPSPTSPPEVAPAPAPTGESVQLATSLDEQNKPAPAANPLNPQSSGAPPQPALPIGGTAIAETKAKDAPVIPEPKAVEKPADALKSGAVAQSVQPPAQPEPKKIDAVKPDQSPHDSPKVEEPAPVAVSSTDKPKDPPAPLPTPAPALTEAKPTDAAKLADTTKPGDTAKPIDPPKTIVDSPPTELEPPPPNPAAQAAASLSAPAALAPAAAAALLDSHVSIPDSRSQAAESKPPAQDTKPEPDNRAPQPALRAASPEPHGSNAKSAQPETNAKASRDLAAQGWVSVPNSGKIVIEDATDADAHRDGAGSEISAAATAAHDARAHTAKDIDFEPESLRPAAIADPAQNGQRSAAADGAVGDHRSHTATGRVEPTSHIVEPDDNFWTISRLYYSSGRYYRALWKANAEKYPDIKRLTVNDVIVVPAVEDLDPDYIDPPRTAAPASLGTARRSAGGPRGGKDGDAGGVASTSSSDAIGEEPMSTARTNRRSAEAVPVRRSSRTDPDLDLPGPDAVSQRASDPDHTGRPIHRPLGDDDATSDEPQTRTAARPRTTSVPSRRRPAYKVRQYDTLRSIARDMLGDSHRAGEIADLNRDLIDDPAHLTVGQMLELPDDARTSVRRSASR